MAGRIGTAYNGHFGCECYHPLFLFNQDGDVERALLRPGNVAIADDWRSALERYRDLNAPKFFRTDAAFAIPQLHELLEAEEYRYAIRLKANAVLERHIAHLLTRPVGRPPNKPQRFSHNFEYQAKSWDRPRRVVAKVEWHQGELFPRTGFIATNLDGGTKPVVDFYNRRGMAKAVDQGGQARGAVDPPAVPRLRRQPGASATARVGAQPGQLPALAGAAGQRQALDADNAAREAAQDRGEDGPPRPVRHVPTGRGGRPARPVPGNPASHPPVRRDPAEGCVDMIGRGNGQNDADIRASAVGVGRPPSNGRNDHHNRRSSVRSAGSQAILALEGLGRPWILGGCVMLGTKSPAA